jgi:hypothetical protein
MKPWESVSRLDVQTHDIGKNVLPPWARRRENDALVPQLLKDGPRHGVGLHGGRTLDCHFEVYSESNAQDVEECDQKISRERCCISSS